MSKTNVQNTTGGTRIVNGVMVGAGDWRTSAVDGPVDDPNAELAALADGTLAQPTSAEGSLFARFLKHFNFVGGVGSKKNNLTGGITGWKAGVQSGPLYATYRALRCK